MNLLRALTQLCSLSATLLRDATAHLWNHAKTSRPSTNGGSGSATTAMSDCDTPDIEGDRVNLGVCDRHPSAKAVALWALGVYTLAFCGHCDRQHGPRLTAAGWERDYLNMSAYRAEVTA